MKKTLRIAAIVALLGLFLVSCEELPQLVVIPAGAKLCGGGVELAVILEPPPMPLASSQEPPVVVLPLEIQWYKDAQPIEGANWITYTATTQGVYSYTITICSLPANGRAVRGLTPVRPQLSGECPTFASLPAVVGPCTDRADVSAIVYGGWNGIPVQAWVGGAAQPTMYTELDGSGRAAVLWTLYPPGDGSWKVSVAPQLPAGWLVLGRKASRLKRNTIPAFRSPWLS